MVELLLGIIIGLLLSLLTVATLTYFRHPITQKTTIIEKFIERAGPRPRGFIVDAPDELDEAREKIIARNKAQGKDTPINDLL